MNKKGILIRAGILLATLIVSFTLWILWLILYSKVGAYVGDRTGWTHVASNTAIQCAAANAVRIILLFGYLYVQLFIMRVAITNNLGKLTPLYFFSTFKNAILDFKKFPLLKLIFLIPLALVWFLYYSTLNLMILWHESHFMGDCDFMFECYCNNVRFLLPAMLVMLFVSLFYVCSVYISYVVKKLEKDN